MVLDPDDAALKATFIPVMEDELLHQKASPIISKQIALLGAHYKIQAHPREINLFYLKDNIRERIEKTGDSWTVLNTDLRFTESELLIELQQHPERFSPNVMLRGLYQETILPDVAFIGGGAEVAYWLQLQTVFEHYQVFYPSIHLRQSVMCIGAAQAALYRQLELNVADVFKPEHELIRAYIAKHSDNEWQTKGEAEAMEVIFNALQVKATALDPTLGPAAAATLTKMRHRLQALEQKMLRAEKRKMQTEVQRIERLKKVLFPNNGLQERVENFTEYYLMYGPSFFDTIMQGIVPLANEFLVIEG